MATAHKKTAAQASETALLKHGPSEQTSQEPASGPRPTVSVIVPAFNHEAFVDEAVKSVLEQTYGDFELIVIDDGSTDGTAAKLKAHKDHRIRCFSQANIGAPATINRGIGLARGRYVSILNSDDVYHADRLKTLLELLEGEPALDAAFTYLEFIDDAGRVISHYNGPQELWLHHDAESSFKESEELVLHLLAGNFVCTTSNLFCRREVFTRIEGFQDFRYVHDHEFFLRLCFHCNARVVAAPLVKYRLHAGNTIKENEPATDYERGIVLASFLLDHDLTDLFPDSDQSLTALKFLNSFDARSAARMVLTLLLFVDRGYVSRDFLASLPRSADGGFRAGCLKRFKETIDDWQSSQLAWAQWREANDRLNAATEENKRLWQASQDLAEENARIWREQQEAWAKWKEVNENLVAAKSENRRVWEEGQEAWAKWREVNDALVAARDENKRVWQDGQDAWAKWNETNERLIAIESKVAETSAEHSRVLRDKEQAIEEATAKLASTSEVLLAANARIAVLTAKLDSVLASASWRFGRLLTYPARSVRQLFASSRKRRGE